MTTKLDSYLISNVGATDGDALVFVEANNKLEFASISSGIGILVYENTTLLPSTNLSIGSLAYVSSINKLYIWQPGWYNIPLITE
jgi:hypothetical protein